MSEALAIRAVLAVLTVGGCYSPEVRDCTVSCGAPTDCMGNQVCGAHGFCATEGVACSASMVDAGIDAAPETITLRVKVNGTGKIVVAGIGECDDSECMWQVPRAPVHLQAVQTDDDKPFERWVMTCTGTTPTCTFTPTAATTVEAKFR